MTQERIDKIRRYCDTYGADDNLFRELLREAETLAKLRPLVAMVHRRYSYERRLEEMPDSGSTASRVDEAWREISKLLEAKP